jgi:hypothetical protein
MPILVDNFMNVLSRTLKSLLEVISNILSDYELKMIGLLKRMRGVAEQF